MKTLDQLAKELGAELRGDGAVEVSSIGTLATATHQQLAFLANSKYRNQLAETRAAAVILKRDDLPSFAGNALITDDPYVAFAKAARSFQQQSSVRPSGIHPSAVVDPSAVLGEGVSIGANSVIGAASRIGAGTRIGALVHVGDNVQLGANCELKAGVGIEQGCVLGDRVIVHPGAVIGADGFGLARDRDGWIKIPQVGAVEIGDDCEIGANTTIDRGAIENTVLEHDVRLDNQIQIAHNVRIGAHTVMAGCTAVAGSARIGRNCLIGGGVGIVGHIEICDGVTVQAMSLVTRSITRAGSYSAAPPLQETGEWRRSAARYRQLDRLSRRVSQLEKNDS